MSKYTDILLFIIAFISWWIAAVFFVFAVFKSAKISKYLKNKNPKLLDEIHGIIKDRYGVPIWINNFKYWRWICKDINIKNKELKKLKNAAKKSFIVALVSITIFILIVTFMIHSN